MMTMTINGRRQIFRILQYLAVSFILIAPFIQTSNGYSLIRFDVERLRLYLFNNIITFDNFFPISVAILLFTFICILITQAFGRIWCGWLCPQSFFGHIINDISSKFKKDYRRIIGIFIAVLSALILSLNWMWYFIPPKEFVESLFILPTGTSAIIWYFLFVILFMDFAFAGFRWCRYLCPYAKMQTLMSDEDTLYIGMLKDRDDDCIKCMACVKNCPVKIDPRNTPDNGCVYCEQCILTCHKILAKKNISSVLGYRWGSVNKFTLLRINLLITLAVSILLSIVLLYNITENKPLSISYTNQISEITTDEYSIKLDMKNGTTKNMIVTFSSDSSGSITPNTISIKAKTKKEVDLIINTSENSGEIHLKAVTDKGFEEKIIIRTN